MQLQFLGAVRQVTGSQYYLKTNGAKILVDCGMFQEREFMDRNWNSLPVRPRDIDAVLLTHAHVDHCGLLPKLIQEGFRGPILATSPSVELVELVLRDSAQIQAEDAEFKKKRHGKEGRQGRYPEKPLYTLHDVERTIPLLTPVAYGRAVPLNGHVSATFHDAGHILGSAMIEVVAMESDRSERVLFSGDMGQPGKPFVHDPTQFTEADYLVVESTYGDRIHEDHGSIENQLAKVIEQTVHAGGKVIIPIFAIERAQELLYYLGRLVRLGRIPSIPVYLDSPMAASVNEIFRRHRDCFAPRGQAQLDSGDMSLAFHGMKTIRSVDESKALNHKKGPAVIMATNGMCTAGRIKHHLAQYIDHPECTILFVGYQACGTLGRQILDGRKEIRLHGRDRWVRARVEHVAGFSGHADKAELMRWLHHFTSPPRQVFVTHGEEASAMALAGQIREEFRWEVTVPEYQQVVELGE
jgi:metallo-beta-lactamase family protein